MLRPLNKACETATPTACATWPRLLIIEGLDECSGQAAQLKILDAISNLMCQTPFPLSIFLSCRPEAHIRTAFQTGSLCKASMKIQAHTDCVFVANGKDLISGSKDKTLILARGIRIRDQLQVWRIGYNLSDIS